MEILYKKVDQNFTVKEKCTSFTTDLMSMKELRIQIHLNNIKTKIIAGGAHCYGNNLHISNIIFNFLLILLQGSYVSIQKHVSIYVTLSLIYKCIRSKNLLRTLLNLSKTCHKTVFLHPFSWFYVFWFFLKIQFILSYLLKNYFSMYLLLDAPIDNGSLECQP